MRILAVLLLVLGGYLLFEEYSRDGALSMIPVGIGPLVMGAGLFFLVVKGVFSNKEESEK